nr:uncharacterized protein LOC101511763 isoform X2 [Cicer arietinum]XP_027189249.1 uncharacterized protein LOC101511646 isoform X2 [Cicer arietinum]XP_027189252.1 uncharacterized protein LOC101511319 isoform X2 [Cicer arietinum]
MSSVSEDSTGLLSPPFCDPGSVCKQGMAQDSPVKAQDSVQDKVTVLHKSNEPYRPPCLIKALPPWTKDINDLLITDKYSEYTSQEKAKLERCGTVSDHNSATKFAKSDHLWESYLYLPVQEDIQFSDSAPMIHSEEELPISVTKENASIPDVQIQKESELNSSNSSFDGNLTSSDIRLPDEDSLITYDGPFSGLKVEIPPGINSLLPAPESNLTEDELDSPGSVYDRIVKLVESVLEDDEDADDVVSAAAAAVSAVDGDDADDEYYFDPHMNDEDDDESFFDRMDDFMLKLVQHGTRFGDLYLSMYSQQPNPQFYSDQMNPGRDHNNKSSTDPASFSLFSDSYPSYKTFQPLLTRFSYGVGDPMFQKVINPSEYGICALCLSQSEFPAPEVPSCMENPSLMQNAGSCGDGNINQTPVDHSADMKLEESKLMHPFMGGFTSRRLST